MHEEQPKGPLRYFAAAVMALVLCTTAALAVENGERSLIPVGHTVGVKLFSRGVVVVKLPEGTTPARACGLKTGDVILECGGESVTSTEQFQSLLQENGTEATELAIKRDGSAMTLSVEPERNDAGVCCIGAWIRDSMAGIGTVTYYDPETRTFGALGHGITDGDTAALMPFGSGSILASTVKAVKKGGTGSAGELRGDFDLSGDVGTLYANTSCGIFGTVTADCPLTCGECVPAAEPKAGPAVIRANVAGDAVEEYTVEILKVLPGAADGREMVLSVTDPALIAATGGIVQGMSGSPILQDGKLVGAVTHVLLSDATKGYGISIGRCGIMVCNPSRSRTQYASRRSPRRFLRSSIYAPNYSQSAPKKWDAACILPRRVPFVSHISAFLGEICQALKDTGPASATEPRPFASAPNGSCAAPRGVPPGAPHIPPYAPPSPPGSAPPNHLPDCGAGPAFPS